MPDMRYRQCVMVKGRRQQTAWLPGRFARLDSHVRLGDEDGWLIVWVGTVEPPAYVLEHKRDRRGDFGSLVNA